MTAFALEWFWWIFATFGIVGIIAVWFLAPTVATMILKGIIAFFSLVFGYRLGCAIVAAVVAFLAADYHRARIDEVDWKRRQAAYDQAQIARDKKIDADARAQVRQEIADEKAATATTTNEVQVYEQALPVLPPTDTICRVGSDADKLRAISGSGRPQSKSKLRLPKLTRKRVTA